VWTDEGSVKYGNPKVNEWIKIHGGEPGHDEFLMMTNQDAKKILPPCIH
jgi:hypothetical protein